MTTSPPGARIVVSKDGPYIVSGNAPLADQTIVTDAQGNSQSWEEGNKYSVRKGYALCRCGHSNSKPFATAHTRRLTSMAPKPPAAPPISTRQRRSMDPR